MAASTDRKKKPTTQRPALPNLADPNQQYEIASLSELKKHPRNVNQGDFGAIDESVQENGFYGAILAQRSTGYILAGNHRYDVLVAKGATQAPVIWVDVEEDRALRILLADNRTTRLGLDNPARLLDLLQDLQTSTGTLAGTGYDGDALDELLNDLHPPDFPEEGEGSGEEAGYSIEVSCSSEEERKRVLKSLRAQGLKCKAS